MSALFSFNAISHTSIRRFIRGLAATTVVILLSPSTVAAQETVQFETGRPGYATGITNLVVDGTEYDVTFVSETTAEALYDGVFDFTDSTSTENARDAVADALEAAGALEVGTEGTASGTFSVSFNIAFGFSTVTDALVRVFKSSQDGDGFWSRFPESSTLGYATDARTYARFARSGASGNQPPVADAGDPHTGTVGTPVVFDGSGSYDPDGIIVTYFLGVR